VESHLQMIQATVSRLTSQSTAVKGWCVTLTAALLGFGVTTTTALAALLALYVTVVFAVLDGYYLALERSYRELYEGALAGTVGDWVMRASRPTVRGILAAIASPATALLYGTSALVVLAVGTYLVLR
jgi:hypothetical protein